MKKAQQAIALLLIMMLIALTCSVGFAAGWSTTLHVGRHKIEADDLPEGNYISFQNAHIIDSHAL